MLGPHRRPIECEHATTLEDPIDDGLSQVFVVEDSAPSRERLVECPAYCYAELTDETQANPSFFPEDHRML
jgi:hypothetical protein